MMPITMKPRTRGCKTPRRCPEITTFHTSYSDDDSALALSLSAQQAGTTDQQPNQDMQGMQGLQVNKGQKMSNNQMMQDCNQNANSSGLARMKQMKDFCKTREVIGMGFYSRYIFPHILERCSAGPDTQEQRRLLLASARGEVPEIGFGTVRTSPITQRVCGSRHCR